MVDILWTLIGFLVGVVTAGAAVEFGIRKILSPPETSKLTTVWSLSEMPAPLIAATALEGVTVPRDSRVVMSLPLEGDRNGFELRKNVQVKGNFVVDAKASRALLFLDGVRPGALALWTIDERLIERLRAEFNRLWSQSSDIVESVKVAHVLEKSNRTVQTAGTVQDVVPYRGSFLMRLSDDGETVGVLVEKDLRMQGRRVSVTGVVKTSSSGYPLIEALEVRAA